MVAKIKTIEDCTSHDQYIQIARTLPGAEVKQKGKYVTIRNPETGDCMQLYDDCVTLGKPVRRNLNDWFKRLFPKLLACLIIGLVGLGYLAAKYPWIVAAAIKHVHG